MLPRQLLPLQLYVHQPQPPECLGLGIWYSRVELTTQDLVLDVADVVHTLVSIMLLVIRVCGVGRQTRRPSKRTLVAAVVALHGIGFESHSTQFSMLACHVRERPQLHIPPATKSEKQTEHKYWQHDSACSVGKDGRGYRRKSAAMAVNSTSMKCTGVCVRPQITLLKRIKTLKAG